MLICFFDQKGIIHKEFVPPGQTVNAVFCFEVLKCLQENVRGKRPDQWRNNTWRLHRRNKNSIQSMEKSRVISTEEGKASEKQHQVNVYLFL